MKAKLLTLLFAMLLPQMLSAQNQTKVPLAVEAAFQKEFPKAKAHWEMAYKGEDASQMRYEATFQASGKNTMAVYDKEGALLAIETSIKLTDLPLQTQEFLQKNYAKHSVKEAAKIVNNQKIVTFEVGLQSDEEFVVLQFDQKGNNLDRTP